MEGNKISIIIPAFHAAECVKVTIDKIRRIFGEETEIIVVINESREETLLIVEKILEKDNHINSLYFRKKVGKGKAILEGFKIARGDILGFIDADAPFQIESIKKSLPQIYSGRCDCLIFSKWKGFSFWKIKQNFIRKCLSRLFNFLARNLLKLNFRDTQGGAKFIKKDAMEKIGYDFVCNGFVFDLELLTKLIREGMIVKEIPIEHYRSNVSTVNIFRDAIPVFISLLRLRNQFRKFQKRIGRC